MSQIEKKYQIGVRKFGLVNWVGVYNLYVKEVTRFFIVWVQTLLSPIISSLLFLSVLSLAIGNDRGEVLGFPFISFLAPGLIAMSIIQQSFAHSSSSIMIGKIQGNIIDTLLAPLSAAEVTLAIIFAAVTRSIIIAIISIIVFSFIIKLYVYSYFYIFIFTFLGSFVLGSLGFITGIWAEKFDHMASVTNFLIVPLSFLSGTFYTIGNLPQFLQIISKCNPFFYMIDGFRYGFLGKSDGSLFIGSFYLIILAIMLFLSAYLLYKKGYKIKS